MSCQCASIPLCFKCTTWHRKMLWEIPVLFLTGGASVPVRKSWPILKTQPSARIIIIFKFRTATKLNGAPKSSSAHFYMVSWEVPGRLTPNIIYSLFNKEGWILHYPYNHCTTYKKCLKYWAGNERTAVAAKYAEWEHSKHRGLEKGSKATKL